MMKELEARLKRWHDGHYKQMDIPRTYSKLLEETGEIGEAIMHGDTDHIIEEIGDATANLIHLARHFGPEYSFEDIIQMMVCKMEERERTGKK